MSHTPILSRVLIVPGLPILADDSLQNAHFRSLSIGLVIDDGHVTWGEYEPDSSSGDPLIILREKIIPILEGRPLAAYREMMAELDALTETAVLTRTLPQPPPGSISRRGFLTGNLEETAVRTEQVAVERPLSPNLLCCISQTLLTAAATAHSITVAELIAAEYMLPLQPAPVPLHLALDAERPTPDMSILSMSILSSAIHSLGYRIAGSNPQAQLGNNGEKLQRFIRQLTNLLSRVTKPDYRPAIQLDVAGGLGALFGNNNGRILGALYGLEQAAKPYPLRITDPILLPDSKQQVQQMRQLIDYMQMRGMKTELAANMPIQTVADVKRFVESSAAHLLAISLSRLGTIQQSIQAVQICQSANMPILLRDGPPAFVGQFALAAQPNSIMAVWEPNHGGHMDQIYREMAKTITILTKKHA